MIVEFEMPDDSLVGIDLKVKVSMYMQQMYFMICSKYNEMLYINDPRVQDFYKELFSSIALLKDERLYFGMKDQG